MYPNTPQYHLQRGQLKVSSSLYSFWYTFFENVRNANGFVFSKKAEDALKFYKGFDRNNANDCIAISDEFERLKAIISDRKPDEKVHVKDLCKFLERF